jgi:hypothetical protein
MAQTMNQLKQAFPWHCGVLEKKGIPMPKISDVLSPSLGDLALNEKGLVCEFDGKGWR